MTRLAETVEGLTSVVISSCIKHHQIVMGLNYTFRWISLATTFINILYLDFLVHTKKAIDKVLYLLIFLKKSINFYKEIYDNYFEISRDVKYRAQHTQLFIGWGSLLLSRKLPIFIRLSMILPFDTIILFRYTQILGIILSELGMQCVVLHSMIRQKERLASLAKFKSSQVNILIATDVASRLVI